MTTHETYEIGPAEYTVNADGLQAKLHPVQVVARFTDSEQGMRAAFKRILRMVAEYPGEKHGVVLARYAPIGKVYTAYGVVRIEYRSNVSRGWLNEAGEYEVAPDAPAFDVQYSACIVEFNFIDKTVRPEVVHANDGHRFVWVDGCTLCDNQRANAAAIEQREGTR